MSSNIQANKQADTTESQLALATQTLGPSLTSVVKSYIGDPTLLDERAAKLWWDTIGEQASRGENSDLSPEHANFSRYVIDLSLPAHLSCVAKIEIAFRGIFEIQWRTELPLNDVDEGATVLQKISSVTCRMSEYFGRCAAKFADILSKSWTTQALEIEPQNSLLPALFYRPAMFHVTLRTLVVHAELGKLSDLTHLRLSGQFRLPNECAQLTNLVQIDLTDCNLQALPALDQLPRLWHLNLTRNPKVVLESPCIKLLLARGCEITQHGMRDTPWPLK